MRKTHFQKRKRIGEILVTRNLITPAQLNDVLQIQKETSKPLGQILVEKEILTDEDRHIDDIEELQDQIEHMSLPIFLTTQVS